MNKQILARWIAGLLAILAIVFALAVNLESRGSGTAQLVSAESTVGAGEAGEAHQEGGVGDVHGEGGEASEQLFGVNLESPWLVWGFVVVSLVVAAAALPQWTEAFVLAALIAALAAVLDVREVFNQTVVGHSLIAILAGLIAIAHVVVVVLAIIAFTLARSERPAV